MYNLEQTVRTHVRDLKKTNATIKNLNLFSTTTGSLEHANLVAINEMRIEEGLKFLAK